MYVGTDISCCGIREIEELRSCRTAAAAMKAFVEKTSPEKSYYDGGVEMRRDKFRYAIFSGTKRSLYVDRFAAYIRDNKLGEVVETGWNRNPNSNNLLKACIWTIDWNALKEWSKEAEGGKRKPSAPVAPAEIV